MDNQKYNVIEFNLSIFDNNVNNKKVKCYLLYSLLHLIGNNFKYNLL